MVSDGPADSATLSFVIDSKICDYNECMSIWENPVLGEVLSCHRVPGNARLLTFNAKTCAERMKAKSCLNYHRRGQMIRASQPSPPTVAVSQQPTQFARQSPPVVANQPTTGVANEQSVKAVQVINDSDIGSDASPDSSLPKKKSKNYDVERTIMGEELSDLTINYAQELLKMQFKHLNGFHSTLLQDKVVQLSHNEVKDKVQIIFCSA